MVEAVSAISNSFLSLSAQDLRELTDWPDPLIEDYLAILRSLLSIATIVDVDIEGEISANMGKVQLALGKLSSVQKQIADLEGSSSANSALIYQAIGKLTGLNKGLSDIDARESADYSANLVATFSIFGAPPAIGTVRISPGHFSQGAVGTKTLRDDIDSITPKWQVEGVDATASLSVVRNSNDALGSNLYLGKSRATENGGVTIVQNNDEVGSLVWVAADGSDLDTVVATILAEVDDTTPAAGSVGTLLRFLVMDTAGALNEFMEVGAGLKHKVTIGDNISPAWNLTQATNSYIFVDTINGSEAVSFGNVTTNPDFNFFGTGNIAATSSSITLTNGDITLTNGALTVGGALVGGTVQDQSTILIRSGSTLTDNAGAGAGTLTNAPTAGDPTKWVEILDNGTSRFVPTWT